MDSPVPIAINDTWLQLRATPKLYLLLWTILSLVPFIIIGQTFMRPLTDNWNIVFEHFSLTSGDIPEYSPQLTQALRNVIFYYLIIWIFNTLMFIYCGAVLSSTIGAFRKQNWPRFKPSLKEGAERFKSYAIVWIVTFLRIFGIPLLVIFLASMANVFLSQNIFFVAGFFLAFILIFSGVYNFGLAPFIHLSTGTNSQESCLISRQYYINNRPTISRLYLTLLFLPFLGMMLLSMAFVSFGIYFGLGSFFIWLLQSFFQFAIVMILQNFAINVFHSEESQVVDTQ